MCAYRLKDKLTLKARTQHFRRIINIYFPFKAIFLYNDALFRPIPKAIKLSPSMAPNNIRGTCISK